MSLRHKRLRTSRGTSGSDTGNVPSTGDWCVVRENRGMVSDPEHGPGHRKQEVGLPVSGGFHRPVYGRVSSFRDEYGPRPPRFSFVSFDPDLHLQSSGGFPFTPTSPWGFLLPLSYTRRKVHRSCLWTDREWYGVRSGRESGCTKR